MSFVTTTLIVAAIGFVLMALGVVMSPKSPAWDTVTVGAMYVWVTLSVVGAIVALLMQVVAG